MAQALVIIWWLLYGYRFVLIAAILLSWLPELKKTSIGQFIDRLASPFLNFFRGWIVIGMFDLTTIIGLILYEIGLNILGEAILLI